MLSYICRKRNYLGAYKHLVRTLQIINYFIHYYLFIILCSNYFLSRTSVIINYFKFLNTARFKVLPFHSSYR